MPRCPHAVATNELFTPFYICGGTKVRKKYICPSIFGVLHSKREAFSICRHMFLPLLDKNNEDYSCCPSWFGESLEKWC